MENDFKLDRYVIRENNGNYELRVFYTNGKWSSASFKNLDECLEIVRKGFTGDSIEDEIIINLKDIELFNSVNEIKELLYEIKDKLNV